MNCLSLEPGKKFKPAGFVTEVKNAPSVLLSSIGTWEFLRTREKCTRVT